MALVKLSENPRDLQYAVIRNISADKGSGYTTVNVGLFYDRYDRFRDGPDSVPPARDALIVAVKGYDLPLSALYEALAAIPEWAGWKADE